jgi:hypothetical protein
MASKITLIRCKYGQITIFVILGVVIVTVISLLLILRTKIPSEKQQDYMNPDSYIKKCMRDSVSEAISLISEQGGYTNPENYINYNSSTVGFTCYYRNYYRPCIMQTPQLISNVRTEIENYTKPRIDFCFTELKTELEKRNYEFQIEKGNFSVELVPGKINMNSETRITLTKNQETKNFNGFKEIIIDPVYDFSFIAQEISSQESEFCYFDYLGFMILYPRWKIQKQDIDGQYKVYTILEKKSGRKFVFAVRSCALPAGV